jgi:hypothetical protein
MQLYISRVRLVSREKRRDKGEIQIMMTMGDGIVEVAGTDAMARHPATYAHPRLRDVPHKHNGVLQHRRIRM